MLLKKYRNNDSCIWKLILSHFLEAVGGSLLLDCNFSSTILPSSLPTFYKECFNAWLELRPQRVEDSDVLDQIIWNNKLIRVGGSPIYRKHLADGGLLRIKDLTDSRGKFLSFDNLKSRYSHLSLNFTLSDFLLLQGIMNALPKEWKQAIRNNDNFTVEDCNKSDSKEHPGPYFCLGDKYFMFDAIQSRDIYKFLIEKILEKPSGQHKYEAEYPGHEFMWEEICSLPFKATIDVKYREFQWKILHRIIAVNKTLFKLNIVESSLCTLCKKDEESLEHLFFRCTVVHRF